MYCANNYLNCIGDVKNMSAAGDALCAEGHIGAKCEECDILARFWTERYSHSSDFTCGKCSEVSGNIYIIALMTIWTLLSLILSVKGYLQFFFFTF